MSRLWKIFIITSLLFVLLGSGIPEAFAGAEREYKSAKSKLKSFQKSKSQQQRRDMWMSNINAFEKIARKHPNHKRACDSLYNVGMLYKGMSEISLIKSDRRHAAETFEKLAARCGSTNLGDDGLYWASAMYVRLHDNKRASIVANRLLKRFPKSDMRANAKELLTSIGAEIYSKKPADKTKKPEQSKDKAIDIDIKNAKIITPASGKARLISMQSNKLSDKTSIKLVFSRLSAMTTGEIPASDTKPRRIYFDFQNTERSDSIEKELKINGKLIKVVRSGESNNDALRLVIELSNEAGKFDINNTTTPPTTTINVYQVSAITNGKTDKSVDEIISEKLDGKKATDKPKNQDESTDNRDVFEIKTIVIDPGHGGEDLGAKGIKGTMEKDIVLAIAKRLSKILQKHGFKTVLTRTNDRTMKLFERTEIANDLNADLFVSIHCNGNRKKRFKGVETFYLNNSSDSYSTRLARRENQSMGQKVSDLDFILTDLSMNANVTDSIALATLVQKSMVKDLRKKYKGIEDRGVRRAVFHVLLYARMPAILVEASFITNPTEEKRLKTAKYQEQIAQGIARGIKQYEIRLKKLKKNR